MYLQEVTALLKALERRAEKEGLDGIYKTLLVKTEDLRSALSVATEFKNEKIRLKEGGTYLNDIMFAAARLEYDILSLRVWLDKHAKNDDPNDHVRPSDTMDYWLIDRTKDGNYFRTRRKE